ncbi:FAD-binding oxidoreductase [Nonomuraea sp. NPDC049309]|uniref:FAD-binding oxidoreductase n=1 Tax=Nonomuraea sp. NPDC049309 TaxID=3364350 RepID=UPI00371968AB
MTNAKLRAAVPGGRVLLPGDDGFEEAARPWNASVRQPVAAVVEPGDAREVAAVVKYAAQSGIPVAAQAGGHGAAGGTEGAILLRTTRLGGVEVRPGERVARVGAGVKWGEVLAEAGRHGLTGLAGSSPVVSVAGYTLGGGLSWFGRRHGFAADAVRAFDVVTADGEPVTVTAESDPELFWALRGGGGDFAVVTAVEFALFPAPALYGGRVAWPEHRAREVFDAYRELTAEAPDELSLWFGRVNLPNLPPMVTIDAAFLGEEREGRALLDRLGKIGDVLRDTRGPLAVADLGAITAEPVDPTPGRSRSELLTRLDDEVADLVLDAPLAPLAVAQVRHLGGALAAARPDGGPGGPVAEPYLLYLLGPAFTPELAEAAGERLRWFAGRLGERASGRKPYTLLGYGERAAAAFTAPVLERLRAIKRARDPRGVLRANYPVLA